ncbi:MAG: threonine--tRNA ligase, partial [Candidatus Aenigmarchaeota archaeon]|nr:threonine--tRNA ligase [Candidatus Aenigmarchaeota archaeon]MDW8149300.1 threonine--tRNA ligase [Candidatus Aenigmarchaeota archaeon]
KRFSISIKGHPLAEQFKEIEKRGEERKINKKYFILTKDGKIKNLDEYKFENQDFKILVEQEALGTKKVENKEPRFIEFLKRFGIEWESFSDIGHMRYNPIGCFIFDIACKYAEKIVKELKIPVYFVKGTNMFDLKRKPIAEHASLFGQRMYQVDLEDKQLILRYAACFQQFSMIKDWNISYKHLPFGAFEIADSYRFEQSGELLLSFRTRKLTMPDLHVFCKDLEEAKNVFVEMHEKIHKEMEKLGRKYISLYNLTSENFLKENMDFFKKLLEKENTDVLICLYESNANYYWILNIEYHIIDELGRAREIGTIQIDVGNAERFDIKYIDKNGEIKRPIILHSAIIGSIERFLYTIFDNLTKEKNPKLPLWLSPIQIRILPVSEKYLEDAINLAKKIKENEIRVDIDDRNESVERKIRDAEISLINYIVVFCEREKTKNILSVRKKGEKIVEMSLEELIKEIENETKDYPFLEINLPLLLSKRPIFNV